MKYIIMLTIVLCLAGADFLTGIIKAYGKRDLSSAKMRTGGLNKLCELIVMAVTCGLEIGIDLLGRYYHAAELAGISGAVAAGLVFTYIVLMELISILENYGEISPDAVWVRSLIQKLRRMERKEDDSQNEKGN
ncbi:MAG: phage holin family protein [Oscillospiraceae bacterium]|nr:phage holin family protein [Oscillospiraceae bacterium]